MAEKDKKYYWLKLKRDFFKRHDIRIIEALPNGKDYILFYLKLLCESVDHDGSLRFSDKIPYSEEMLATVTDTNVDVVRAAIQMFAQLDMMEVLDDGTYFMTQVEELIGSETYWAKKKREQKLKESGEIVGNFPMIVQQVSNESPTSPSKSKSKSKSIDNNIKFKSEFDELWKSYPRKQGKKKAFDAYVRARKNGTTFEEVRDGIESYNLYIKSRKIDSQYIKMGATFFCQNSWQDELDCQGCSQVDYDEDLDGIL